MEHVVEFPGLGLTFTTHEVAFTIGSFEVRWYGVIIAIGFLLAVLYAFKMCKAMRIDANRLIDAVIVGLIAGVVCARLYYVLFYTESNFYWENPIEILKIHEGGLAIYGGLIGAVVGGGLMAKARKLKVPAVLDIASLGFLIGQGIGRWGNFVNQEAFGSYTDLPWGMISDNTRAVVPEGPVHPCFLYESLLCLLGFAVLQYFNRKLRRYDGQTFLLYSVYYGVCRFFIEGLRTDSLFIPGTSLRVSQVLAGALVIVGVILLIAFRHRTSLTGCGSKRVMEGLGIDLEKEKVEEQENPTEADAVPSLEEHSPEEFSLELEDEGNKAQKDEDHGKAD